MAGVPIPPIWPQAHTTPATQVPAATLYTVMLLDEGHVETKDVMWSERDSSVLIARVEGLPDTICAIQIAIDQLKVQFPTHPCNSCLVLDNIGPLFGMTRLKGNSMVHARGATTDAGFNTGYGITGSTGTVVLVKMQFKYNEVLDVF